MNSYALQDSWSHTFDKEYIDKLAIGLSCLQRDKNNVKYICASFNSCHQLKFYMVYKEHEDGEEEMDKPDKALPYPLKKIISIN